MVLYLQKSENDHFTSDIGAFRLHLGLLIHLETLTLNGGLMNMLLKSAVLMSTALLSISFSYTIPDSVESKIQSVIDSFTLARPDIKAGISISVKTARDQFSYARGLKSMDNPMDSINTETNFMIFSITKNIVCAYALDMVRKGELRLYDKIGQYYDFNGYNPNINNDVTIEQLMNHRSGINDISPQWPIADWSPFYILGPVEEPMFEPGTAFTYSNTNTIILGIIIQLIKGDELNNLLRERFYEALGIEMYLMPQDIIPENIANLHGNLSLLDPSFPEDMTDLMRFITFDGYGQSAWTAGCMISSPKDIAKWGFGLFHGRYLPWIGKKMEKSIDTANTWPIVNWVFGLGCATVPQLDRYAVGFHGYGTGTSTSMYYTKETKSCITIFVNQVDLINSTHAHRVHFPLTNRINEILEEYLVSKEGACTKKRAKKKHMHKMNMGCPVPVIKN